MAIYLTLVLIVLNHIAFGGSRVVVSLYALESGATQMQVGMLMALYALCPMLFAIAIGRLADRVGPRLPMLLGSAGLGIALLLTVAWPALNTLFIASFLLGSSFHFFFVTVTGVAGGIGGAENRSRNYALVSLGFSGAGFLGPLIAGFAIDYLGHIRTFMILAAFTVIPVLMLWRKPGFLPGAAKVSGDGATGGAMDCGGRRACATPSLPAVSFPPAGTCSISTCRSTATASACRPLRSASSSASLRWRPS
jgi:MFS family permease